ncbi:hypothetical protein [Acidiplasma sp.]|uniref:hypothetical protein n=1 Tax=Acidiplasma sp. TaxID=1872114 RepID=UPI00258C2A75|nr:hypothetical protein [Acidiplasma sp.]
MDQEKDIMGLRLLIIQYIRNVVHQSFRFLIDKALFYWIYISGNRKRISGNT